MAAHANGDAMARRRREAARARGRRGAGESLLERAEQARAKWGSVRGRERRAPEVYRCRMLVHVEGVKRLRELRSDASIPFS